MIAHNILGVNHLFGGYTMKINDALKRCRKLRGHTQKQAAAAASVSESMYQFYEYGKNEPTASVLIALADYFDVSLDYLVGRSDDPNRY